MLVNVYTMVIASCTWCAIMLFDWAFAKCFLPWSPVTITSRIPLYLILSRWSGSYSIRIILPLYLHDEQLNECKTRLPTATALQRLIYATHGSPPHFHPAHSPLDALKSLTIISYLSHAYNASSTRVWVISFYPVDAFYCDSFAACNVFILQAFFHECLQCIQYIIWMIQNLGINQPIIQRCEHMQSYLLAITGIYDCKLHAVWTQLAVINVSM